MPLARIDVPRGRTAAFRRIVGDVVYESMLDTLKVPANDRFQVISEHDAQDLLLDRSYLGVQRSSACIVIQVTLNEGRSVDQKREFYRKVADGLHERAGMRREDVLISLVEVNKENWSFGNGEAQYA
ncbi:MAG TPA: tautomerase family protein [Steroidobacteraceae bacterium]|jgi:4-oxalocrotonate tautomerase|nr:tautomerase family protein [Steroidobacteraceae bacterium]